MTTQPNASFTLMNPALQQSKGAKYKGSGKITFAKVDVNRDITFLDYLAGGLQVSLLVAIGIEIHMIAFYYYYYFF